jgi:hypothetical protein
MLVSLQQLKIQFLGVPSVVIDKDVIKEHKDKFS